MSTDPAFLASLAVAVVAAFAVLVALWRYSGASEAHAGPWDRPPDVAQPSPVPPGFQLVLDAVDSGWDDDHAWRELVDRLGAVASSIDAAPPARVPTAPDEDWFRSELNRLEGHLSAATPEVGGDTKGINA